MKNKYLNVIAFKRTDKGKLRLGMIVVFLCLLLHELPVKHSGKGVVKNLTIPSDLVVIVCILF